MPDPCPYEDLGYRPTHGYVDVRGERGEYQIPVTVAVGRAMEADGIPIWWPYASCPAWAADMGLAGPWMFVHRIVTLPSQFFR